MTLPLHCKDTLTKGKNPAVRSHTPCGNAASLARLAGTATQRLAVLALHVALAYQSCPVNTTSG